MGVLRSLRSERRSAPGPDARLGSSTTRSASPSPTGGTLLARELAHIVVQPALKVGSTNDPLEQEAEQFAGQACCSSEADGGSSCAECRQKAHEPLIQRRTNDRGHPPSGGAVHGLGLGSGRPLGSAQRGFFEPRVGGDLGAVRVHTDGHAGRAAERLGARAFTVGHDIAFAPGEYRPEAGEGQRLLAHELAHVIQQRTTAPGVLQRQPSPKPRRRHSGPVDWKPGVRATLVVDEVVDRDKYGDVYGDVRAVVKAGSLVEVVANPGFGFIQVQLVDPKARTKKPLQVHDLRLEPVGPTTPASATQEGVQTHFQLQLIDEATARSLGVEPALLPEGQPVSLPSPAPGIGVGLATAPWPAFPVPAHATGVQWTQTGFGHFSQLSNVPGSPTIGGYRSWGLVHGYQAAHSALTGRPWTTPVPGRYFNDWWFRLMSPGTQTIVWREGTPQHAQLVAELIHSGRYTEPYSFPPSAPGTRCTNCITVPQTETFGALGGRPVVVTDSGVYDITEFGRGSPNEPFTMEQAGRRKTMTNEWLANPKLQTPTGEIEPLNVTKTPASTVWGARGVTVIRAGGFIMLIYGVYSSAERLEEAAGTPHFDRVVAQETGSWIGGLLGGALGTAAAAAIACSPTGPGAFVCAAAGLVGGLLVGGIGSMLGSMGGDYVYEQASGSIKTAGEIFNPMIERAIWGNDPIPALGYYPPREFGQDPVEYKEEREHEKRSWSGRGF